MEWSINLSFCLSDHWMEYGNTEFKFQLFSAILAEMRLNRT